MDLSRLRRAPAGIARRGRMLRQSYAETRFRTRLGLDTSAPALLLSPHWDDAVFDCWGLLTDHAPLTVVNVFAGVPPEGVLTRWDRITGARDSAARAHERIAEDSAALALAGRRAIGLPLLEAEYREPGPAPSLERLDATLTGVVPTASRIYAPATLGSNRDHRLVRSYALALLRSGLPVSLYADLPYCVVHGWPHWVDGSGPEPHRDVDAFWHSLLVDVPELGDLRAGRVTRLDDERAAAKLEAMRTYSTQFPALDGGATGLLANPEIHRFEVVWELG